MKKNVFLTLIIGLISIISCGSDNEGNTTDAVPELTVSHESISIESAGGETAVTVKAVREWGINVSERWIKTNVVSGRAGETVMVVSAEANPTTQQREGTVEFMSGTARQTLRVVQDAAAEALYPAPDGYSLVWHDEFEGASELNAAYWSHEVQGAGWVNNELQTYVNHKSPGGSNVTELRNGSLMINCFKENGRIYSGRVYANVGTGWQYGYIEARIKLPRGRGTWPAFWMMPCNVNWATEPWPYCGEIDIMEEVGCVPDEVSSSLHASGHNHTNNTQVTHAMTIDKAEGEFHVYALEWTSKKITTYVDGKVQLTYDNPNTSSTTDPKWNWPYDRPYYVILNLAWGGDWGGMKGVDENALPVTMEVDYVRVFQKK